MKIDQKGLDETWGLFINMTKDHDNDTKDKFIQLRDKLQKEIDEKGYADTNDPKLTEWWLEKKQMPKKEQLTEKEQLKKDFNNLYQCKIVNLCKALGITVENYNEYTKDNQQSFNETIRLAQLKTLLEIKEILIDNIIEKGTEWHRID